MFEEVRSKKANAATRKKIRKHDSSKKICNVSSSRILLAILNDLISEDVMRSNISDTVAIVVVVVVVVVANAREEEKD